MPNKNIKATIGGQEGVERGANPRLLVIGVDAFSANMFKDHLRDNTAYDWLFNEIENGTMVQRTLHSLGHINPRGTYVDKAHTGPEWSSMYTGVGIEEHGVTSEGWLTEGLDYDSIETKTVFEALDDAGLSQCVYSMPVTYPAPDLKNGWAVSGFPSPLGTPEAVSAKGFSHVKKLAEDVPRNILQVKEDLPKGEEDLSPSDWGEALEDQEKTDFMHEAIRMEFEKAEEFVKAYKKASGEVAYYGTTFIDKMCHMFGLNPDDGHVMGAYTAMGVIMRDLVMSMRPDNLLIVSDHGFEYGKKTHDNEGIMLASMGDNDVLNKMLQEKEEFETKDVAEIICRMIGAPAEWMGEEREEDRTRGDREEILERLRDMGYIDEEE